MKKNHIIYSVVIILTIAQCYILLKYNRSNNMEEININNQNSITEDKNVKNIKEVKKDLSNYKTLSVLSYNKLEDGNWKIKCSLKGSKEDVIKDIEEIKDYEIIDYSFSYEKDNLLIEVDIKNK